MTATLPLAESEDLVLVRDSARGLLQDAWPATRAVALATDCQALKQMWVRAAAQGWTGGEADLRKYGKHGRASLQFSREIEGRG